jgi:hypothetical protein|tara:strand:- start:2493 stop:2660 length:168 start_codon:yes stop_codon:yes gene_type:complete
VRKVELEVFTAQSPSYPTRIEIREVDFGIGVIPEPSSAFLLGAGCLMLAVMRRKA